MAETGTPTPPVLLISSINKLPNELLAHIFLTGAGSEHITVRDEQQSFAVLVSSVSRRWRETAIALPSLWSRWTFHETSMSKTLRENVFLQRSRAHPLNIIIYSSGRALEQALAHILPHSRHWRELSIMVWEDYDFNYTLASLRDLSVPILWHFELKFEGWGSSHEQGTPHRSIFVLGAPVLTSVKVRGLCAECGPPLNNLTVFRYDAKYSALSHQQLQIVAAASPALRSLQLRLDESSGNGTVEIPSLRDLSLNSRGCRTSANLLYLFANIVAPGLECLELISLKTREMRLLRSFCEDFPQYPRPRTLKLSNIRVSWKDPYDTIIRLFPTVTSLYLLGTSERPTLSLLPALKSITYNHNPFSVIVELSSHDHCVRWISEHVKEFHGTPQAMESVRLGYSARKIRGETDYQLLQDLTELVELDDEDDILRHSWDPDDEEDAESEDEDEEEEEEDEDWSDQWDDEDVDYDSEDEDEWESE
ncbi:hypothetical protein HWV62_12474 [Athelia sp. TMB]|nr:hypothetical protein HWV62_12474 [Athelia sp. TMB]